VFCVGLSTRIIPREKSWGTIRSVSYLEHIVPALRDWLPNEELVTGQPHYIVQDQAPSHTARATREQMTAWGMRSMNTQQRALAENLAKNPIGQLNESKGVQQALAQGTLSTNVTLHLVRNFGWRTTVIIRSTTHGNSVVARSRQFRDAVNWIVY
jgi:hypothetical protein